MEQQDREEEMEAREELQDYEDELEQQEIGGKQGATL